MIGVGACLATSRTSSSGERPSAAGRPDEHRRSEGPCDGHRIRELLWAQSRLDEPRRIDRERSLVVGKVRSPKVDETAPVHHGDHRTVSAAGHAVSTEVSAEQPGDADRGGTRAQEEKSFAGQPALLAAGGQEARPGRRRRSLDVVVEARQSVAVAVEDPQRVVLLEVLPLDDGRRKDTPHRLDERLHHLVVGLTPQPGRAEAEIERVVEELRSVGPDVERHGQRPGRVDAGGRRIQRELADRDRHATRSLIAKAQDPFVISDDDEPNIVAGRGPQDVVDTVDVRRRDPYPAWPTEDVAEFLAGATDRRRVDDRQELLQVFGQHPVEQGLVPILERRQTDEALEIVGLAAHVLELERDLLLDRGDAGGQQTAKGERVALLVGEGRALVEQRLADEVATATADGEAASWRLERRSTGSSCPPWLHADHGRGRDRGTRNGPFERDGVKGGRRASGTVGRQEDSHGPSLASLVSTPRPTGDSGLAVLGLLLLCPGPPKLTLVA